MSPMVRKTIIRMLLVATYGCLGGWIFTLIEKRDETYSVTADRILGALRQKMLVQYNMTNATEFDMFVTEASDAMKFKGMKDWTILNGIQFGMAAILTVGYGDITPQTASGKGFVIPFCLIGLPLAMAALKTGGELIDLGIVKNAICAFQRRVLGHKHPGCCVTKRLKCSIINMVVFLCLMATLQMYLDEWTFVESLYCWFVTFSTIGFGDYVPLQNYSKREGQALYKLILVGLASTVPYFIGMCLISSFLNVLGEFYEGMHSTRSRVCDEPTGNCRSADNPSEATQNDRGEMHEFHRRCSV